MRAAAAGMRLREERSASSLHRKDVAQGLEAEDAEETLSLIVTKADFAKMTLVGQFNLGFILAMRHATSVDGNEDSPSSGDQLFIIDQHASDEKFNFERLQATTVLQSQRLVHPKRLDLTALEEEIVKENITALERNGFQVRIDESGSHAVGSRCELVALPLSRETTFSLDDLEELISLLGDDTNSVASQVPRPSKVRKIFAMRACRSSIMIGRALTRQQMGTLVRHMGQLDKPWNCPHGRPTMRHLCGLQDWDAKCWQEDDVAQERPLWAEYSGGDGS
jgi:DNA mismatch repair protein PMS2